MYILILLNYCISGYFYLLLFTLKIESILNKFLIELKTNETTL